MTFYLLLRMALIVLLFQVGKSSNNIEEEKPSHQNNNNNYNKIRIQQVPWSLNETLASKVTCVSSPPCKIRYYLGYEIERSAMMLVDNKNKILLEIVPKADCSGASVMFFQNIGFHYGVEYNGWPHHFRKKYFYNRCGRATPCMMYDPNYYRFKIVRNPFSRVVSGFIHIMRSPILIKQYIPLENRKKITFNHFIEILKQLNDTELQHYGQGHCSYQSQPYERDNYGKKDIVIYHSYVHAEDSDYQLEQINQFIGSNFSLTNIIREGVKKNTHYQNQYVGNVPWWKLKDRVPRDYGLFYNSYSKKLIEKVFHWDLLLYNYTFPYQLTHSDDDIV